LKLAQPKRKKPRDVLLLKNPKVEAKVGRTVAPPVSPHSRCGC